MTIILGLALILMVIRGEEVEVDRIREEEGTITKDIGKGSIDFALLII
jgi:hypothetical protein